MKAILKRPGQQPELKEIGNSREELIELLGGAYVITPALFGAMVFSRNEDHGLEYNCHFLSQYFYGPVLVVGRGEGDKPCDLPLHLHKILLMALREGKR